MRLLVAVLMLPAAVTLGQSRYDRESPVGPPPDPASGAAASPNSSRELLQGFDISQGDLPANNQGGLRAAQPPGDLPFGANSAATNPLDAGAAPARSPVSPPPVSSPPTSAPATTPPNTHPMESSPYARSTPAATGNQATTSAAAVDTDYAKRLMTSALTPPSNTQLSGDPVYLTDVVARAGSRSEQSECIGAYWDLCSAVADYYLSLRELSDLNNLVARSGQTPVLQQSLKKLEKRRDTALSAARASQRRLASLMDRSQVVPLPLPGDQPLCAGYHTRYSQYFSTGESPEAAELDRLLPLRHAELLESAAAVKQAETFFNNIATRPMNGQGEELLMQLEGLALKRRAFVQIARDYNKRVARYTELARPGQLGANRLVSMLIKTGGSVASRPSQPAQPALRNRSESGPLRTFQDSGNPLRDTKPRLDEDVMTTSGEEASMVEKVAPGEVSVLRRKPE